MKAAVKKHDKECNDSGTKSMIDNLNDSELAALEAVKASSEIIRAKAEFAMAKYLKMKETADDGSTDDSSDSDSDSDSDNDSDNITKRKQEQKMKTELKKRKRGSDSDSDNYDASSVINKNKKKRKVNNANNETSVATEDSWNNWSKVEFNDDKQKSKFLKLMGAGKVAAGKVKAEVTAAMAKGKSLFSSGKTGSSNSLVPSNHVNRAIERQYHIARTTSNLSARGGLGFVTPASGGAKNNRRH